ncbi:MAG TPA: RNase adapter RapZ [Rhodospirillales bacterium]|nr:RNase adapter RapZ [Rhodospirillales bacterium]
MNASKTEKEDRENPLRVLLVTGMSGAGKTSALKALEDLGYEAVDNVPLSLIGSLISPAPSELDPRKFRRPIAIGIDIRTRDFGVTPFFKKLEHLVEESGVEVGTVFLDCDDDELRRRYAETRHRHPLAIDRPVSDGIAHERRLLESLRDRADVVLDTTGLSPGALKGILKGHVGTGTETELTIFVVSFSFKRGLPRQADLVFDVRFLANPHYNPDLRPLSGRDGAVADFITGDSGYGCFFDGLTGLLFPLLPRYTAEGKSYLTIAVGCTGGRHRSVFVAEQLAAWLEKQGQGVHLHHRDLNRT